MGGHVQRWQVNHIKVTQTKSMVSLECMSIDLASRTLESPLTNAEISGHRSGLGQLLWLGQQSRPDLCVGVSLAAQKLRKATLSDVKALNKLVEQAKSTAEMGIVIPCGVVNLETYSVVCYADAGFANAEGEKSQCGLVCCLTHYPELVKTGRSDLSTITSWQSSTIKRVVRSTLAADGYAVFERSRISSMVSVFVDGSAHGSQLSEGRREGEFEEASTRVHCQR